MRLPRSRRMRQTASPSVPGISTSSTIDVGPELVDAQQRVVAVDRRVHVVALEPQRPRHGVADVRVVLDDEDAAVFHGPSLALAGKSEVSVRAVVRDNGACPRLPVSKRSACPRSRTAADERQHRKERLAAAFRLFARLRLRRRRRRSHHGPRPGEARPLLGQPVRDALLSRSASPTSSSSTTRATSSRATGR